MKTPTTELIHSSKLDTSKIAPELQIHVAATLVVHGDPFSKNPNNRNDKAGEIAQFCVPIPSRFVGKLKRHHIDEAFENLKASLIERLRKHGVLAHGE